MRWRRRAPATPHDDWTTEVSSGLALAGFLFLVFVGFTLLAMGPLISIDTYFNLDPPPPGWVAFLHVLDRIGQRAVCLPILAVATFVACRHRESWRPAWVVAISVFSLNLMVLILKVLLGRGQPEAADPSFFVGGMAYPSGHTANIVLVYGLVAYLLSRYRNVSRTLVRVLWSAVALLSLTMATGRTDHRTASRTPTRASYTCAPTAYRRQAARAVATQVTTRPASTYARPDAAATIRSSTGSSGKNA